MLLVKYNDFWLRIIAAVLVAHFIVMYGVEKSLFQVLLTGIYYIAMFGSIVIALTLMWFVRFISIRLDRKFDWIKNTLERTGLQILLGLITPGLLAFLMAFVYFSLREINILKTLYLRFDYPIILLLILFLNLYYLAFYFYGRMRIAETLVPDLFVVDSEDNGDYSKSFLVNQGAKNLPIPIENIAYFFREGDFNFLRTFSSEDFAVLQSLDEVQESVNGLDFFRANRQILVSRKACKHFEALPYNKLELFVEPVCKFTVVISQKRSRAFKTWLDK